MTSDAAAVIWLTGLPASGKTTLAKGLVARLRAAHLPVLWLDSDDLRRVISGPAADYSSSGRDHFYDVVDHLATLAIAGGCHVVISATAAKLRYRAQLRAKSAQFLEVYLSTPAAQCRQRDPKGLYAAAEQGTLANLPGFDADFEAPEHPEIVIDTSAQSADACLAALVAAVAAQTGWPLP